MWKSISEKYRSELLVVVLFLLFIFLKHVLFGVYFHFFLSTSQAIQHLIVETFNINISFLEVQPYLSSSFFLSAFKSPVSYVGVILFIYLFLSRKKVSWNTFSDYKSVRILFLLPAFILTWELISTDYNYYLDQSFILERVLLVLFLVLIYIHPIYVVGFLMLSLLFRAQFNFPIGGFPLLDIKILYDLLILLLSFIIINTKTKIEVKWLIYSFMIIVVGHYYTSGWSKIIISPNGFDWILDNRLDFLLINQSEVWNFSSQIGEWVASNRKTVQLSIILIEVGSVFFFFRKRVALILLAGFVCLHLAIFYFGGVLFWKWIFIDLGLIVFIIKNKEVQIFNFSKGFKLSLILIPLSVFWLSAPKIGWFDTKLKNEFYYKVVLENNEELMFSKDLFNPYASFFHKGKFFYTLDKEIIPVTGFGYTKDYNLAQKINNSNINELREIQKGSGRNFYSPEKAADFYDFIKTYIQNVNNDLNHTFFWNKLAIFKHFNFGVDNLSCQKKLKIKKVKIFYRKTFISNRKIVTLENKIIKEIVIY